MDVSAAYRAQCDCPEIQKQRGYSEILENIDLQEADYYATKILINNSPGYKVEAYCDEYGACGELIWLPRQDQLQGMINCSYHMDITHKHQDGRTKADILILDGERTGHFYQVYGESLEQLWLAFAMSRKFDKVWDGKEWIQATKKEARD